MHCTGACLTHLWPFFLAHICRLRMAVLALRGSDIDACLGRMCRAAVRSFGWSQAELTGRDISCLLPDHHALLKTCQTPTDVNVRVGHRKAAS